MNHQNRLTTPPISPCTQAGSTPSGISKSLWLDQPAAKSPGSSPKRWQPSRPNTNPRPGPPGRDRNLEDAALGSRTRRGDRSRPPPPQGSRRTVLYHNHPPEVGQQNFGSCHLPGLNS